MSVPLASSSLGASPPAVAPAARAHPRKMQNGLKEVERDVVRAAGHHLGLATTQADPHESRRGVELQAQFDLSEASSSLSLAPSCKIWPQILVSVFRY